MSLSFNLGNWVPDCSKLLLGDEDQPLLRADETMMQYCFGSHTQPESIKNSNRRCLSAIEAQHKTIMLSFKSFFLKIALETNAFQSPLLIPGASPQYYS